MGGELYRTLSIAPGASSSDIKKAYRKKALKYHPDKVAGGKLSPPPPNLIIGNAI